MSKKSIFQDNKECWVCDTIYGLHLHHVYGGPNRKISDREGFTCYLCGMHHNLSNHGVHFNRELDLELKRTCQKKYEETHTRDEFRQLIGRSYILD